MVSERNKQKHNIASSRNTYCFERGFESEFSSTSTSQLRSLYVWNDLRQFVRVSEPSLTRFLMIRIANIIYMFVVHVRTLSSAMWSINRVVVSKTWFDRCRNCCTCVIWSGGKGLLRCTSFWMFRH